MTPACKAFRRILSFLGLSALLALTNAPNLRAAESAYLIQDNTTGFVLEQVHADRKLQIGSLTKIASAMVVLDWADASSTNLSDLATVPASAQLLRTTSGIGLRPGDRCSLRDLLYASMMQSDNVAAETLADHVGRALAGEDFAKSSTVVFVAQMNALARKLGMAHTRFLNAHGLDTVERSLPYSTALDLALLARYAMDNSGFRFYVTQKERRISFLVGGVEPTSYLLRNTNELLGFRSVDGVKTGTTRRAGSCLIVSEPHPPESRQEGETHIITPRRINVILLNCPERFERAKSLLEHGWQLYEAWAAAGRPVTKPQR
jgi:D-alanyl-D-alanine carboxypeptidase (penicillin-binding protein 5/6)